MSSSLLPPARFAHRLDRLEARVREHTDLVPRAGIVLGSGLGEIADSLEDAVALDAAALDEKAAADEPTLWPATTAPGHAGRLILGRLEGVPVVCLQGRVHLYEGHPAGLVVQPVLLMGRLGAREIVLTNAAGGINTAFRAGTLMIIADHLNLTGTNPLLGPNDDRLGPRFPDLTDAWDPALRELLAQAALEAGVELAEGVYAGLLGPNYETPAETRMLRALGTDAVGMSTVLEAIAARWMGLRVCGVSLITNEAAGTTGQPLSHEEVLAAANEAGPRLARVLRVFVRLLGGTPPAEAAG